MPTKVGNCDECHLCTKTGENEDGIPNLLCGHPRNLGWWRKVAIVVTPGKPSQGIGCPFNQPLGLIETAI